MANAGTVNISLIAETAQFVSGMNRARNSVKEFGQTTSVLDGVKASVSRFAATAGPIAMVGAAFKIAINEAKRLDDISDATGLAAGEIVRLEMAARSAGVEIDGISQAMMRMNVVVGNAISGNKEAAEKLEDIGISIKEIQALSPDERFRKIGEAIGGIADRSRQAAVASEIFGKSSAKLIDMFSSGSLKDGFIDESQVERINRSSAAMNKFSDHVGSAFADIKTKIMVGIGTAMDYWGQKIGAINSGYAQTEKQVSELQQLIQENESAKKSAAKDEEERYKKQQVAGTKRGLELAKNYKEYDSAVAAIQADTDAMFLSRLNEEDRLQDEHNRKRESALLAATRAGMESSKSFQADMEANEMAHQTRMAKIKIDKEREVEAEIRNSNAHADELLKKMIEDSNEEADEASEERRRKEKEANAEIESATRRKVEMGSAYAQSLGNIINMTDELKDKSSEAFYVDKAAKMAAAIVNAWVGYTAALTIPPPAGQILAGTTLAAGMFAASQIAAQKPAGRANGGAVVGNNLYEVAERGPELLHSNGKTYLMNGDASGRVQPMGPGGGGRVTVNVNNLPGQTARVTEGGTASQPTVTIDIVDSMVAAAVGNARSQTSRAMASRYGLNAARGAQ